MAITDIPGFPDLGISGFNFSSLMNGIGLIILAIFVFVIIGGIAFFMFIKTKNKKLYNKTIHWFEEVNGDMIPTGLDIAREITIPNSSVTVFYIKKKNLYLPRPVIKVGKEGYWICIRRNRELVNFRPKNLNEDMKESNLDYDHTDMRYALTNLQEMIKRNYRDKSQPWWKEFKEVIGLVILIFVLTLSFVFIAVKMGDLADKLGILIDHVDSLIKSAEATRGSGVIAV